MLKNFVEIKFEICSSYKTQGAEEKSPLKFTKLFQKTQDTSVTHELYRGRITQRFCKMLIAQLSLRSLLKIR